MICTTEKCVFTKTTKEALCSPQKAPPGSVRACKKCGLHVCDRCLHRWVDKADKLP